MEIVKNLMLTERKSTKIPMQKKNISTPGHCGIIDAFFAYSPVTNECINILSLFWLLTTFFILSNK